MARNGSHMKQGNVNGSNRGFTGRNRNGLMNWLIQ